MNFIYTRGIRTDLAFLVPAAGSLFTEEEWEAIGEAVSYKGTKRVAWRKSGCPYGTPGYVFQQARIMALNPHRMPSQFITLFNGEQRELFWSLANKMGTIKGDRDLAAEFNVELKRRFS